VDRTSHFPAAHTAVTSYCEGSQRDAQADIRHCLVAHAGAELPFAMAAQVQQSATSWQSASVVQTAPDVDDDVVTAAGVDEGTGSDADRSRAQPDVTAKIETSATRACRLMMSLHIALIPTDRTGRPG
jgi:hypothetical protein